MSEWCALEQYSRCAVAVAFEKQPPPTSTLSTRELSSQHHQHHRVERRFFGAVENMPGDLSHWRTLVFSCSRTQTNTNIVRQLCTKRVVPISLFLLHLLLLLLSIRCVAEITHQQARNRTLNMSTSCSFMRLCLIKMYRPNNTEQSNRPDTYFIM